MDHAKKQVSGKRRALKITAAILCVLVIGLIGVRLQLPVWVRDYVNREINRLPGYDGGIASIDLDLWRGAYKMHDLRIFKTQGGLRVPFVAADEADLSVEWRALLHGRIVAKVALERPDLNFAMSQTGQGVDWAAFVDRLSPLDIDRLDVHDGKVAYLDTAARPAVNIYIAGMDAHLTNLRNVDDRATPLPSDMQVTGTSIGNGRFKLAGRANILQDIPDFDIDVKLENAALPALNDYARAAAAVDFEKGRASVYSELAAADGHVTGYLKFLASDVSVIDARDVARNPLNAVWQAAVAVFMGIFKNQPRDQFALNMPIDGSIKHPEQDGWSAFLSIFRNAFGRAFSRDVDGNVNFLDALEASGG